MPELEPSQWEQDVAEAYVLNRPLFRPPTRLVHAIAFLLGYSAFSIAITAVALASLLRPGSPRDSALALAAVEHPALAVAASFCVVGVMVASLCGKTLVIGCIHLYQHYAPEDIRRRCLFRPTCSEYAILAVSRYGVFVGALKTYNRIRHRCRGTIYTIDYP